MPVVPTPPTIDDGVVPSSEWNQFRDAINFLMLKPIAQLRQTSAQSIPNATFTPVAFQAETVDDDINGVGGHDNVTNNTRWVCRYPGYYLLSGMVIYSPNVTGVRQCGLRVNSVNVNGSFLTVPTGSNEVSVPCKTMRIYLAANDFVELAAWHSAGGALNTYVALAEYQSGLAVGWDRS